MDRYILGIDVGGSRTRALVASPEGAALGFGEAGPGNHEIVGYGGLLAAMRKALASAMRAARATGALEAQARCAGAGFGVAGYDWPSERPATAQAIDRLGLNCPIELRGDGALGLAAGSASGWGVNLSAGTSNACYALSPEGREWCLSGAGAIVGENGGGSEIAFRALVAVNYARLGRIGPTALTDILCRMADRPDADSLVEAVSLGELVPEAAWAPEIFAAARGGDETARGIIDWAGRELGESAAAAARSLGFLSEAFDLVLAGSLFALEPRLEEGVAAVLGAAAPRARLISLGAPPVVGAAVLGAAAAGVAIEGFRPRLLQSARGLARR